MFKAFSLVALLTVVGLAPWPTMAATTDPALDKALEQLRASADEWRREDGAFRAARKAGKLSKAEADEYAAYVASLRARVIEQCATSRKLGGDGVLVKFDCPTDATTGLGPTKVAPSTGIQTDEEKRAALNAQLNALESGVDEDLLKRQQQMRAAANNAAAGGMGGGGTAGGGAGSGSSGSGNSSGNSAASGGSSASGTGQATGSGGAGGAMGTGSGGGGANPNPRWGNPDKGTGGTGATAGTSNQGGGIGKQAGATRRQTVQDGAADDDVVARQLREAAEKETDPVLKEKLWAEYKKYKESKR